jgi:hypothetical protein
MSEFDETAVPKLPAPNSPESAAAIESLSDRSPSPTHMDFDPDYSPASLSFADDLLLQQHVFGCGGFTHGVNRPQKVKVPRVQRWITLWMFKI